MCPIVSISVPSVGNLPEVASIRYQQAAMFPPWVITEKTPFIAKSTLPFTYIFIPKMPLDPSLFFIQSECSDDPFYHHALSTRCKGPTLLFL